MPTKDEAGLNEINEKMGRISWRKSYAGLGRRGRVDVNYQLITVSAAPCLKSELRGCNVEKESIDGIAWYSSFHFKRPMFIDTEECVDPQTCRCTVDMSYIRYEKSR